MTDLPAYVAALPGLFVGLIAVGAFNHWLSLLLAAMAKDSATGATSRGWATVFTLVHPVPWLLAIGGTLGFKAFLRNVLAPGWVWLWGAAILTFMIVYGISIVVAVKVKTSNSTPRQRQDTET